LTNTELPLLKNIQRQCTKAIATRHQLLERNIQALIDYHPVYWHLQVRFHVKSETDSEQSKLENICKNLEGNTWYYKTTVLKAECKLPKLVAHLPEFKKEDEQKMKAKQRFENWKNVNQKNGDWRNGNHKNGGSWRSGAPSTSSSR
jgi:hypothetical protein